MFFGRGPPILQLPVLRVTPSLVNVPRKVRQFTVSNWAAIVQELCGESFNINVSTDNLALEVTEEELRQAFTAFGKVYSRRKIQSE